MKKLSRRNLLKTGAAVVAGAAGTGTGIRYADAADRAGSKYNWGHTMDFGEQYYVRIREILGSIARNEMNLIGDLSARMAGAIAKGGNVWYHAHEGHMCYEEFNMENKGSVKFFVFIPITMARNLISLLNAAKASQAASFGSGVGIQQQTGIPVKSVAFEPLQLGVESESMGNIALLLDVPMRVTVELGRTKMTIKDILGLGEGSIIELDKLAGEPVDILVSDKLIAQGEVVVIDENFAVRVTKIVTPMERIFDSSDETV